MRRVLITLFQFLALIAWISSAAAQTGVVGTVIFVSGPAEVQTNGAAHAPLKVGDAIQEGQELITKSQGYVYIKTSDNGFISLRPNSALQFETYQYAADKPKDSRIKLNLKYGVIRSISGTGAQSARDKYRLNTPVAAIGIRGTDFTVYSTDEVTRAAVTSGGIVMSPFGDNCKPGGTGPCSGAQIAELFAQQSGLLLQQRRGEAHPLLLDRQSGHLLPDSVSPPLPNESAARKSTDGQAGAGDMAGEQAIVVKQGSAIHDLESQQPPATVPPPVDTPPVVTPPTPPTPPTQQVFWGRWMRLAGESQSGDDQLVALTKQGKLFIGANSMFGVVRDAETNMVLPSTGVYNFALKAHESYILNDATKSAVAANILNPVLTIDFNQRHFDTSFKVTTDLLKVDVAGHGSVLGDGSMVSDLIFSPASILGTLANGGQQAGFIYQQRIDSHQSAVGATYWTH